MGRTWWGATVKYLEFADGYIYEFSIPLLEPLALMPRPALSSVIFWGRAIKCFNEDDRNYIAVWVDHELHNKILPEGPLPTKFFSKEDMAAELAAKSAAQWKKELSEQVSGPLLVLEKIQEEKAD